MNQIVCEMAAALAAGCTMVLKPSDIAPPDAIRLAEILEEAGVPPGVIILVNGNGPTAGRALSLHLEVDMTSFPGSTIAGLVLCISTDADEEGAIRPVNNTPCGSAAFVQSGDPVQASAWRRKSLRDWCMINTPPLDRSAPFDRYKPFGNGRQWSAHGVPRFLRTKVVVGNAGA